ncbi:MAG: hypothetical protein KGI10_07550 [Thaumarchaeota archaeon]|nr:hypothetical protein [Nitrososphaerota archaeon]
MKILLSLLIIPILILSGSQAFGQQLSMGDVPNEVVKITIDETGTAHVTHVINSTASNLKPIQVDTVDGKMDNLTITDNNGKSVEYATIEKTPVSIIIAPSQRNMTLIKYNLVNVVTNTDGVWKWKYYEPQDTGFTAFHFPKGVDMVWANSRPVYLGDMGLGQHGNGFALEYVINEPMNIQTVQLSGNNIAVGVRTVSGLGNYAFDQTLKSYSFNIDKANVPVTVIMPKDLLAGPYAVTINGNATLHTEFHDNATHAWIGFEPSKSGIVQITGGAVGQGQAGSSATIEQVPTSTSDNTSIYILIGGIIAAGIAGIIIVKKTRKTAAKP